MPSSYNDSEHPDADNSEGKSDADQNTTGDEWILDSCGSPVWRRSADGKITYYQYDAATGLLMRWITDVNIFLYNVEMSTKGYHAIPPRGWNTPPGGGAHCTTECEYDHLDRCTRMASWEPGKLPDSALVRATTAY
jgi:hypothetical protein